MANWEEKEEVTDDYEAGVTTVIGKARQGDE